MQMNPWGIEV